MAIRIGINGFGRIGRLFYRIAAERGFEVVAVNDLVPADNLAYLLKYDTMHRRFMLGGKPAEVERQDDASPSTARSTMTLREKDPGKLPWKSLGVDYVLESTGLFTELREGQAGTSTAGAKRVLISAPTKSGPEQVPTFCLGVNHDAVRPRASTPSSATRAAPPTASRRRQGDQRHLRLEEGLMTTVHAATATQPTQDGPSKKDWRGGRNAYQNIIPASTGAAKAVTLCIPALKGKLTGMAFRVPTADVSVVDLTFRTAQGHQPEGDQRGDEGRGRRRAEGHPRLHRRGGRLERLHRRPPLAASTTRRPASSSTTASSRS